MQVSGLAAAWHPDGKRISIWVLHAPADLETFRAASFWTALATGGSAVTSELSPEILKRAEAAFGSQIADGGGTDFRSKGCWKIWWSEGWICSGGIWW